MKRVFLPFMVMAVAAFGGTITTTTDCSTDLGCSTSQVFGSFNPAQSLGEVILPPLYPVVLEPGHEISQTTTIELTFYTAGPPRPGYLDLIYGGYADGARVGGYYARGTVTGLFSWSCFALGCADHVFIPITLGNDFEIVISARSVSGRLPWGEFPFYGGQGMTGYTVQTRETASDGPLVTMFSSPEPHGQAFLGLLLLGAGLWVKSHLRV